MMKTTAQKIKSMFLTQIVLLTNLFILKHNRIIPTRKHLMIIYPAVSELSFVFFIESKCDKLRTTIMTEV